MGAIKTAHQAHQKSFCHLLSKGITILLVARKNIVCLVLIQNLAQLKQLPTHNNPAEKND